jgi:hypothetical protein
MGEEGEGDSGTVGYKSLAKGERGCLTDVRLECVDFLRSSGSGRAPVWFAKGSSSSKKSGGGELRNDSRETASADCAGDEGMGRDAVEGVDGERACAEDGGDSEW